MIKIFSFTHILSKGLAVLPFLSFATFCGQPSQVLRMAENKRLEATICADSMNRIAVANDRITQLFGDEGTFESQNDENTGQVFLKPTAENGTDSLSLTLVTEQGVTQDLTLKPTAKSAATLILTRHPATPGSHTPNPLVSGQPDISAQNFSGRTQGSDDTLSPWEDLLTVLKLATAGHLPVKEEEGERTAVIREGVTLTRHQSWQAGVYAVDAFWVENLTGTPLELEEKDFYQAGDLALSLDRRVLPPQGKALLYAISRKEAVLP